MSGPALRQVEPHRAIHAAMRHELQATVMAAETLSPDGDQARRLRQVVEVFLELVETRILAHAHEEEAGLYAEWLQLQIQGGREALSAAVASLVLQHSMLRQLASDVERATVVGKREAVLRGMREFQRVLDDHERHEEDLVRELLEMGGG